MVALRVRATSSYSAANRGRIYFPAAITGRRIHVLSCHAEKNCLRHRYGARYGVLLCFRAARPRRANAAPDAGVIELTGSRTRRR